MSAGLLVTACLLTQQRLARAEEPADRARELFLEGRDAMKRSQYSEACAKFEDSQRRDPSLGTVLNLSVCEEHRGHLLKALGWVKEFLASAAATDARRASAEQLAVAINGRLSRLALRVTPTTVSKINLTVDGNPQEFTGERALDLDPGRHELTVGAAGYSVQQMAVELSDGERLERNVVLTPSTGVVSETRPKIPPPATPAASGNPALPPFFYVALGTGLVGALTVVGSGIMIASERSTVREHCTNDGCDTTGLRAGQRGKAFVVLNTLAWPVAVAGASLAVYIALARSQRYSIAVTANPAEPSLVFRGQL